MHPRILIVDDQPIVLNALRNILKLGPYIVHSALSGPEGLDILAQEPVDVVISDERMPGMPGSEFLAIVREKYPLTVRIMLTGYASLQIAIRAINEGEIFRFLTKPIKSRELHTVVQEALAHQGKRSDTQHLDTLMDDLEKQAPGITHVKRDSNGCVIIDDGE